MTKVTGILFVQKDAYIFSLDYLDYFVCGFFASLHSLNVSNSFLKTVELSHNFLKEDPCGEDSSLKGRAQGEYRMSCSLDFRFLMFGGGSFYGIWKYFMLSFYIFYFVL